jgi:hypothetical protein
MTENTNITPFEKRCEILADLWLSYSKNEELQDFIVYNDLALPFAYGLANNLIEYSASAGIKPFINEAWDLLLTGLGIEDDNYDTIEQMLDY